MPVNKITISLLALVFATISYTKANAQGKSKDTANKKAVSLHISPIKYKGLQISRNDLIQSLSFSDSTIHFKSASVPKGLPKLLAKDSYGANIEITGTEDNITKVQWATSQPAKGKLDRSVFTHMAYLMNIILQQDGTNWFFQQLYTYNQNPNAALNSTALINGNKIVFVYDSVKKSFILSISVL